MRLRIRSLGSGFWKVWSNGLYYEKSRNEKLRNVGRRLDC